jgi:UDP-N-acetylglucosamine 4,6-dehydratase|tara:strand:- start:212 stop:1204 length:993 start_codon:yes stop_codon:yes gene_type:complete
MLNNKSILITGGTGSFGKAFIKEILKSFPNIRRLVIFSRDELKQFEMSKEFPEKRYSMIRYFIGDIRDRFRLQRAFQDIDVVIHAAALKQVPTAEYNPMEFIQTNVIGAQNVIEAAIEKKVKKVISLSTDKAAAPINLYGATKLCSDKLFVAANNYAGLKNLSFSVVRYGNVMGSRGSVIPFFKNQAKKGKLSITDKLMTRFNITLKESVSMVLFALKNSQGGEIFVPKIPSYKITDLAKAICPNCIFEIIGIRQGEKIHEEMITSSDSYSTIDIGKYYVILPANRKKFINYYSKKYKIKKLTKGFSYNSGSNKDFLKVSDLKKLMKTNT